MVGVISSLCFSITEEGYMKLEKDPVTYLLRSASALAVLRAVSKGKPLSTADVRKTTGLAPQVLKETVDHLDTFGLAHLKILPGVKRHQTPHGVSYPVHIQVTREGQHLLSVVEEVRETLRRHEKVLPSATVERWLIA